MWLKEVLLSHEEFESPQAFWFWSALAAVSAVAKDSIWLDRYAYKLYPNIYVMLHAESGLKKGPPVSMANKLVTLVDNTKIMSGRFSIQGLLKKMGTAHSTPSGRVQTSQHVFICASELSSAIVKDPIAMDILTDLYDRNYRSGHWESILKQEEFKLNDPTITMLTATNEAHNDEFFTKKDLQGGFFARTFIIHENQRQRINSLAYKPKNVPDYPKLSEHLKAVSKLKGEIQWPDDSRRYYDDWYNDFTREVDKQELKDPTGTINRFGDSVLKVAILLHLANEASLELPRSAISLSITECEKLIGSVRKTTGGQGKSEWAQEKWLLLRELVDREPHMISRKTLIQKYWMRANDNEWDAIIRTLEAAGYLSIEVQGNQAMLVMSDTTAKKVGDYLKGRMK